MMLYGFLVGFPQALVLRGRVRRWWLWLPLTGAAVFAAWFIGFLVPFAFSGFLAVVALNPATVRLIFLPPAMFVAVTQTIALLPRLRAALWIPVGAIGAVIMAGASFALFPSPIGGVNCLQLGVPSTLILAGVEAGVTTGWVLPVILGRRDSAARGAIASRDPGPTRA